MYLEISLLSAKFDLIVILSVIFAFFLLLVIFPLRTRAGRILYQREMYHSFTTTYGYVVLILMIFFIGMMTLQGGTLMNAYMNNKMAPAVFDARNFSFFMLIGIPLLTMRSIAGEREENTLELLVTSPISIWTIVSTKFLASLSLFVLGLLISLLIPLYMDMKVENIGNGIDWQAVFGVYLGNLFIGSCLIASGILISSLCSKQLTAMILIILFCFLQLTMHIFYLSLTAEQQLTRSFLEIFSIFSHVVSISHSNEHALYWKDVVYLIFYILGFNFATAFVLERRRE